MTGPDQPALLGLSHLGFSVTDVARAVTFWTAVLGFRSLEQGPHFCLLIHDEAHVVVGLSDQDGTVQAAFDEHRTGLDHLALAVDGPAALARWEGWLNDHQVAHSGVTETEWGQHLNLRGPDEFPVELFVLDPAAASLLALDPREPAVAGSHQFP